MDVQRFMQLISGERKGPVAALLRGALWVLSVPWAAVTAGRNFAFDRGWKRVHRVDVPVIAVGNLTTGGTGKTPVVAFIVRQLQSLGHTPGIVSRGYGADASGENDEKRVLRQLCPDVPHEQNPDRVFASKRLIEQGVDVIVLDDAFQHRRLYRDLNIVLIDATCAFGFGHQLPRGLLRESVTGLRRADVVLMTRADRAPDQLASIRQTVEHHSPSLAEDCHEVSFQPTDLQTTDGRRLSVDELPDMAVTLMTAIGNPTAFVATCQQLGLDVVAKRFFPDHHLYTSDNIAQVLQLADEHNTPHVLTTLKDLVKLPAEETRFLAVLIETVFAIEAARESVRQQLTVALARHAARC
ncbi:MAG: tetraacyldisaccharide 4'-kinase [Planctomycetaceae bacterium]|nr:tetraacyldisaccharide 4'-kinase [Planctomycetaceae bacterium]